MEILKTQHENVRTFAARELHKFGIKLKLKKLSSKKNASPKKRCYGVALERLETVEVNVGNDAITVPKVFRILVDFIKNDLTEEGIFRRAGSKLKERSLVKNLDECYQLPQETCVIEACAVLKIFLRNIPGCLIPKDLDPWFLEAGKLERNVKEALTLCVLLLPPENLYLTVFLMQFFYEVAAQSTQNKMTAYNLAVVLAPNMFDPMLQKDYSADMINVTKVLIESAKTLGIVPAALLHHLEEIQEENRSKRKMCAW